MRGGEKEEQIKGLEYKKNIEQCVIVYRKYYYKQIEKERIFLIFLKEL